jgi:hypothetical protein
LHTVGAAWGDPDDGARPAQETRMANTEMLGFYDEAKIKTVATEVQRIAKARKDITADRKNLSVRVVEQDGVGEKGEAVKIKSLGLVAVGKDAPKEPLAFRRRSLLQLAGSLDIPSRYIDRLEKAGHLDMIANDLTQLLAREPKRHLLRMLDGRLDALLSDRYRAFSNEDLMCIALDEAKKVGAHVWDLRHTPDEFRILLVAPHIAGQIDTRRERPDGSADRWTDGGKKDVINAACTIGNSETGGRKLQGSLSLLRRICMNFSVHAEGVARVHLGRRIDGDGEVIYSDETKKADDNVVYMQIRDVIKTAFNPEVFAKKIALLNETTKRVVEKPTEAVDATIRAFGLPAERKEAILESLLGSNDKTQYGLAQAVTSLVNQANARRVSDDETRNVFEDVGGAILEMNASQFKALLATPKPKKEEAVAASN